MTIDSPEHAVPFIPSSSLSWAVMSAAAAVVLDISTEVGMYHQVLLTNWGSTKDYQTMRQARRAVNRAALETVLVGLSLTSASAFLITYLQIGMDWRMRLMLEGISRQESSWTWFWISIMIPRWIGIYYSPAKELAIQHIGSGLRVLKFHVRYSIGQYILMVFCNALPFAGRPLSVVTGIFIGILLSYIIRVARSNDNPTRQARISLVTSLLFAVISSTQFADSCHYIQSVWGTGQTIPQVWMLGISFTVWFMIILYNHMRMWRRTQEHEASEQSKRNLTTNNRRDRMAVSLIYDHVFGSTREVNKRRANLKNPISSKTLEKLQEEPSQDDEDEKQDEEVSLYQLLKERMTAKSELTFFSQFDVYFVTVLSLLSLFLVVVNVGATYQSNIVRKHFDHVHHALYGNMEQGPVCAFDKVGGTIQTFEDSHKAYASNYTIAHCGACSACSDWHNLRLQYTTRKYLAKESARCAKKSLWGGRTAVLNCLKKEPIGFQDGCAECWTEDISCAKSNCAFIFLQSNLINTFANFQVSADTITSATCEEAMCELEFVPCSGANRRRMRIQSTIARPGDQLCKLVEVDWAKVFNENEKVVLLQDEATKEEL